MEKIYILTESKLKKMISEQAQELQKKTNAELESKILEKDTSLASLQSQMNPHFLYNALEGIRGQAMVDDAPVIADIAHALADYFRYSISSRSDIATLNEEISNIRNYLRIQQFRFNDRFKVDIKYDKEDYHVMETLLPKLTLQPIVENTIAHGFVKVNKEAVINVRIVATMKNVNITISDNGVGMDAETLLKLNDRILGNIVGETEKGRHNGIAMPNVHKRIQLMFGEDYGIHISSIAGIGTDVEIHLPFCNKREELLL